MTFTANDGYSFSEADLVSGSINGKTCAWSARDYYRSWISFSSSFSCGAAADAINRIEVTGVPEPCKGQHPNLLGVKDEVSPSAQATVNGRKASYSLQPWGTLGTLMVLQVEFGEIDTATGTVPPYEEGSDEGDGGSGGDGSLITPKSVALSASSAVYDGAAKTPTVVAKDSSGRVISPDNYVVTAPASCVAVGTYTFAVDFVGRYAGHYDLEFTITSDGGSATTVPATSIVSATALASGKIKVAWTPQKSAAKATGYQIRYFLKSSFSNATKVSVKGASKYAKTVTAKKAGKKHYVSVRAYLTVNGKKKYGSWSKALTVKTKR